MGFCIREDCKFVEELDQNFSFNGKPMSRGYYNLVVSIRDFKLYECGMIPHRGWKPTLIRDYSGLSKRQTTENTIEELDSIRDYLTK